MSPYGGDADDQPTSKDWKAPANIDECTSHAAYLVRNHGQVTDVVPELVLMVEGLAVEVHNLRAQFDRDKS